MKLPRSSDVKTGFEDCRLPKRGFTLIEISIVIGILALIFASGVPLAIDFYLDYQLASEVRILSSVFGQARNLAMVNRNESDHGIYVDTEKFTIFQGKSYVARDVSEDQEFPRAQIVSISGPMEIVFEALSGRAASSTLVLSNGRKTRFVSVNEEGAINF